MNLIRRIKDAFGIGPKLRNKPGGYAWIKSYGHGYGADVLAGHAVRTVEVDDIGHWVIEPTQRYTLTRGVRDARGNFFHAGAHVILERLSDDRLEPWKEDGVRDSEVRDLYSPNPFKTKETV